MSTLSPDELLARAVKSRRDNQLSDALRDAEEAAKIYRVGGARTKVARATVMLGQLARDQGRIADALAYYQEAVAIYRVENDPLRLAHTVRHLGDIYREAGSLDLAEGCFDEALSLYRQNKGASPLDLANTIRGFALLKDARHDPEGAQILWEEARDIYATSGVKEGVAECTTRLHG